MTEHSIGTREEWRAARLVLLKLDAYKRRMGWRFEWISSLGTDFNYDFGVSFIAEQRANGAEYNFQWEADPGDEGHGLSSFIDEEALLRGEGGWWWRRHDEYQDS